MADKKEIKLSINQKEVRGKEGDTILDICRANDIYVPTLCYLEGLSIVGACRLCVVEIEGERRINPACTYPARDGLVVRTSTEKLEKYRRQMLELLFTERNHHCFFCVESGECELQKLAYQYQMDHARYPYIFPALPTDTLNDFLVLDHNRCILCGRCVRVCAEVVDSHTLDFGRRGSRAIVIADLNQPLGESSCISCGACVQACPTGAIFSKVSAYRGKATEGKFVRSICSLCGVGCEIDVLVKDNNIVRIDGVNLTGLKGLLCRKGRFEQVAKEAIRIATPIITEVKAATTRAASWEEALDWTARGIKAYQRSYGADSIAGFVSSLCPNETLDAFVKLMRDTIGTSTVDSLDGNVYRTLNQGISTFSENGQGLKIESPLESILKADCVLVVGADPLQSHPVAGCYILRARTQNQARVLVIDSRQNDLGIRADQWLRPSEEGMGTVIRTLSDMISKGAKRGKRSAKVASLAKIARMSGVDEASVVQAADMLSKAKEVVVVYGEGIYQQQDPALIASLLNLAKLTSPDSLKVISLKPQGNSRGAWELIGAGGNGATGKEAKLVYLLLADDEFGLDDNLLRIAEQAEFLIVQASYASPLTEAADVVFPSPIWAERQGTYVSLDGKEGQAQRVLELSPSAKTDIEVINQLTQRLKKRRPLLWPK
jgi:formate dehydrogenase major subunit